MENKQNNKGKYGKFFAMIATSMVAMFFNVHAFISDYRSFLVQRD